MSKVRRARSRPTRGAAPYVGDGFWDTIKKVGKVVAPIAGVAGLAGAAYLGSKQHSASVENTRQHALLGGGVWDKVKSAGKTALKYGAPIALGLAGAVGAHYLNKGKTRNVDQGTDTSRFTDSSLPYANSDVESSYRDRGSDRVPLTPTSIQALLALKALHSAYEPSANHPWHVGGSLIGPTTLAALAEGHSGTDPKIHHLMTCKHCQGKGIGKDLWNGIKKVGKDVYAGAKNVGKASLPYVVPVGLATGALAAGYYVAPHAAKWVRNQLPAVGNLADYVPSTFDAPKEYSQHWARNNDNIHIPLKSLGGQDQRVGASHKVKGYDHLDLFS